MKWRTLLLAFLLLAAALVDAGCRNDQQIIDQHEQTLLEEED